MMKKHSALSIYCMMLLPSIMASAQGLDSRVSVLEAQMNEVSTRTIHGNIGGKTASSSPQIMGENWYFTGDMLWWHVDEGGTDYAQLWEATTASSTPVENRRLKFKWDYGFRAGIGKIFAHDKWDLFLNFTWFRADISSASSLHGGRYLNPLMLAPQTMLASQVKAHWNLQFYTLDLNLGRSYFVSPKLSFHPFAGVKTAWIDQSVRSSAISLPPNVFPDIGKVKSKSRNDFWGIGPSLGCEGKWYLDYGFHLFGAASGAILWGDFNVHHKEYLKTLNYLRESYDMDLHQVSPMADLQIGIGYETNLYHNSYHLAVNVGYENQYWWNQNQIPQFNHFATQRFKRYAEDLSLQGITVNVRFDF